MSVAVEIVTTVLKDVVYIPIQAILSEEDKHYVFLVDGSGARKVPVEVGENNEESIQIVSGLKEGQEVLLYAPVEAEIRGGLKERPLDKAKKAGKQIDLEPAKEEKSPEEKAPEAAKSEATAAAGAESQPRQGGDARPGRESRKEGPAQRSGRGAARPQTQQAGTP